MTGVYRSIRPLLFRLPPERAHALAIRAARLACQVPPLAAAFERTHRRRDPRLAVDAFGVHFDNPLGIAAGLDKDGDALPIWAMLGFGHVEIGTVTAERQPGNPRPRVTRLPPDRAIVNAMGFPSVGADELFRRLAWWKGRGMWPEAPVGINVGKSRSAPPEAAEDDYRLTVERIAPFADFLVVNVSSPNTPGLRDLQDEQRLASIVATVVAASGGVPALVKLAPDLSDAALTRLAERAESWGAAGLVLTNTTTSRAGLRHDPGRPGGLSGRPLAARSRQALAVVRDATDLPLVSVGGVHDATEAIRRFELGADLVQVYTGLIYEGPSLATTVLDDVARELDRRGVTHVHELRRERR